MTTARHPFRAPLAVVFALVWLSLLWSGGAAAHSCDDPFVTDLVTGTGIDVGEVAVCNDADTLTVTYQTTAPWCIRRAHLQVAADLSGIPTTRLGTPCWPRFAIKDRVHCMGTASYNIPLRKIRGVGPGDEVVVAARAVVEGADKRACLLGDTCVAWGDGTRFQRHLPATYFSYTVQESGVCAADGVEVGGACWFLGAQGDSCTEACAAVGLAYDDATLTYAGSEGTYENCAAVVTQLGLGPTTLGAGWPGAGCTAEVTATTLTPFWVGSPPTTPEAAGSTLRRICACE